MRLQALAFELIPSDKKVRNLLHILAERKTMMRMKIAVDKGLIPRLLRTMLCDIEGNDA